MDQDNNTNELKNFSLTLIFQHIKENKIEYLLSISSNPEKQNILNVSFN